ncbi:hypothetical protein IPJ70_03130 [Candidatus Campbellbacteria bacterium]|nr:MAG: hypothetical protein IPJ70_03130 [Candidatus Campbellbacteria bacterium]
MFVGIKKRIHWALPLLLVVVLLVSVPLPTNTHLARAETSTVNETTPAPTPTPANPPTGETTPAPGTPEECRAKGGTWQNSSSTCIGGEAKGAMSTTGGGANFWDIITMPRVLVAWMLYIVLEILGWLLAIAAYILDSSISFSIVHMGAFMDTQGGIGAGINAGWGIIRDLVNIVFVFALLFVGINTILGSWSSSGFNTKLIPKIILAALLINFSMLFTKIVIDTSNILTLELYTATQKYDTKSTVLGVEESQGLSGAFMDKLGVMKFMKGELSDNGIANEANIKSADKSILTDVIMAIIIVLIAMFMFLVMAFMLLGRLVIFLILIITSPIAFIGELLPQLKSQAGKWWDTLWGQAFFAPIFFALLLVVFEILKDPNFNNPSIIIASTGTGLTGFLSTTAVDLIKYFIVIYLLISALVIAKSVSGDAGKGVAKLGSTLAGGAVFGGTAFLARNSLGRAGARLANSATVGKMTESNSKWVRGIGKTFSYTGNLAQKGTFDARGTRLAGGLADMAGADLGKVGNKGGLVGSREAGAKRIQERAEMYGKNQAVASQEAKVREAQDNLRAGLGTDKQAEHETKLREAQDILTEMRGGRSQTRTELARTSAALTDEQRKLISTTSAVIDAQNAYIKKTEKALENINLTPEKRAQLEAQKERAETNLRGYKEGKDKNIINFIELKSSAKKITDAVKSANELTKTKIGEAYTGGLTSATRTAGDKLRAGSEKKPSENIAKEIEKIMEQNKEPEIIAETPPPKAPAGFKP